MYLSNKGLLNWSNQPCAIFPHCSPSHKHCYSSINEVHRIRTATAASMKSIAYELHFTRGARSKMQYAMDKTAVRSVLHLRSHLPTAVLMGNHHYLANFSSVR